MAILKINLPKIIYNIATLDEIFSRHNVGWTLVVKVLGNNTEVLRAILTDTSLHNFHSVAGSHWQELRMVKEINPEITTMFIKPPAIRNAANIVRFADISLNTSLRTILALNEAAKKQKRMHKVIIMIEMGELREGIHREGLVDFYDSVFQLSNIEVVGLGTNLGCMHGLRPTYDKLIQLVLYQQLLEAKFNRTLPIISGASSITIPFLLKKTIPRGINHFRIGEAAFLGTTPLTNRPLKHLNTDCFEFEAHIVELSLKDTTPDGEISDAAIGHTANIKPTQLKSYKALLDFGILDVDADNLTPFDESIQFFGNSSDLTVYDLGSNSHGYKVGDTIKFQVNYMAVAKLMTSRYIEKVIVDTAE